MNPTNRSLNSKTAGFDSILIDMEHSPLDLDTVSQLSIASLYCGITPLVRSPTKEPFFVSRILDGGALGVIVPHIRSVQDTKDVVAAAKFAPIGNRSVSAGLAHLGFRNIPAFKATGLLNSATMVIPMIETVEALEDVENIVAVEGVDSVLIGGSDLSTEMGIAGGFDSEKFKSAIKKIGEACKKRGVHCGLGGVYGRADLAEEFCGWGVDWILGGNDTGLLLAAGTKMAGDMRALGEKIVASRGKRENGSK
jgi:2-keto-3-deoxy-L-rhamnonate aldolase RhmA